MRVKKLMAEKWKYLTLQQKLSLFFVMTAMAILAVNLYMYAVLNAMAERVEEVYVSNVSLNELAQALDYVQDSMESYLNTKSSEAMEAYYRSDQQYRQLQEGLNDRAADNEILLTEKNIRSLSETYLELAASVIQAKRGRNVERYGALYEDARLLYEEIHTFIYSLNNEQFKDNSRNYQALMNSLRNMELTSVIILLLVQLVNVSLIIVSTRAITKPLQHLAAVADEVAGGNFEVEQIPVQSMDEVGIVTGAFNQMVGNIREYICRLQQTMERENQLMERELMMQSHLKDAQLKYLQAQINPHFLYNTLDMINWVAISRTPEEVPVITSMLAKFYKLSLNRGARIVRLMDEMEHVRLYIGIQNKRYDSALTLKEQIPEEYMDCASMKILLQPIVENAVLHGIFEKDIPEGTITVSARLEKEETLAVEIMDDGAGIAKERLEKLKQHIYLADTDGSGYGLSNIEERIKLCYGNGFGLEFESVTGVYTKVTVRIRYVKYDSSFKMSKKLVDTADGDIGGAASSKMNVSVH